VNFTYIIDTESGYDCGYGQGCPFIVFEIAELKGE